MNNIEHKLKNLKKLLDKERQTQLDRWNNEQQPKKELRKAGELLHPLQVQKHSFDYNSAPLIHIHYPNDYNPRLFSNGTQIVLFNDENKQCNGTIRSVNDRSFELLIHDDEIPGWILDDTIGMKPKVDEKSFKYMMGLLKKAESDSSLLLNKHLKSIIERDSIDKQTESSLVLFNDKLNNSQKRAVQLAVSKGGVTTIQGPPGTGKTTTLVEIIKQLTTKGEKVIASAPSNTAVDNLAVKLISTGLNVVRLGNTAKVNEAVWSKTPEGILSVPKYQKQLKKLRLEVNELRKKAQQFKRNFTKEDRENRKRWRDEARKITKEIRSLTHYQLSKHVENADVILGTPVGLCDSLIKEITFDVAVIDEAGQCLIPMGFLVMDNAERVILCGDQQQLPPTVIDREAEKAGLGQSILEEALQDQRPDALLSVQYRMPPMIAEFSSNYFYHGKIESAKKNQEEHLLFYDTAGAGYKEQFGEDGSKWNNEELDIVVRLIEKYNIKSATFISPYAAQVREAIKQLPRAVKCSTIDGFQGQEDDVIIISLVRNNERGEIGFLRDYRRMNVAMTRAKSKLIVVGDSATLASDKFYQAFIDYAEENNCYRSVFELLYA